MSRAEDLDAAISEIEKALVDLKTLRSSPTKSRASMQRVSTALNGANGRLARIMHARYVG